MAFSTYLLRTFEVNALNPNAKSAFESAFPAMKSGGSGEENHYLRFGNLFGFDA